MTVLWHQSREYILRALTACDINNIVLVEQAAHSHPWSRAHFESSLLSSHQCLALVLDSAIIAYAITSTAADEAELLNITVAPQYQRQGIGQCLLGHISQSFNATIQTLFLEVRASNQPAIQLYHKLGFNEVGQRPQYYPSANGREDALIMAKLL